MREVGAAVGTLLHLSVDSSDSDSDSLLPAIRELDASFGMDFTK